MVNQVVLVARAVPQLLALVAAAVKVVTAALLVFLQQFLAPDAQVVPVV